MILIYTGMKSGEKPFSLYTVCDFLLIILFLYNVSYKGTATPTFSAALRKILQDCGGLVFSSWFENILEETELV